METREEKKEDKALFVTTAVATFLAAFGVSGGTNVWMLLTGNDLIKKYRPTLTFRSAIFGDGLILPFINVIMMRSLRRWKPRLESGSTLVPLLGGSAVSLLFHVQQGNGGLVNWTMPKPWRWNLLGYYHFVYMSTQFSYMLLYITELVSHLREEEMTDELKRDLAVIGANLVAFGLLLYTDYY